MRPRTTAKDTLRQTILTLEKMFLSLAGCNNYDFIDVTKNSVRSLLIVQLENQTFTERLIQVQSVDRALRENKFDKSVFNHA